MRVIALAACFATATAGMTSAAHAARYFYAACHHESHGYMGYNGPRHSDAADAAKDCAEHRRVFPRHRCGIEPIDY